jgi:hypothetical protein
MSQNDVESRTSNVKTKMLGVKWKQGSRVMGQYQCD